MDDVSTSPCMVAHNEVEKNRHHHVNYAAILFNKIALSENLQMGINTDNLGMGLSAILKGVYQVRAIGSGATLPPSVFTHTVPANMTVGKTYQVAFSGVTSAKGAVTYTLSSPANLGSMLGFSKGTGILADENITVSVHADTGGGTHSTAVPGNYSLEVQAYAGQTLVSSHTVNFTLVAAPAPVLTGTIAVSGASGTTTAGGSATFRFSGVTADTGTVTYSIANSGQSYFTFSKSTNIAANEAITVTAAANTPTGSYNFTISANTSPSASNGPVTGSCSQSVTAAVVTPTMSGTISHNIPSTVTAGSNYSVTFGGKSATSGTVLYSVNVNSGSQYVSFSKTSGIAAGETVTMSVASNAPNGGSIGGTISANTSPVGASNGPDSVGFSLSTLAIVEPDPTFSGFNHTVPTNTQQGQSYTVTFSGTSSSNGRPVWYSLSPQTGLSFSKLDNISSGEAVTLTIGGSATGTLAVTVYANTTKNNGSTFTQSVAYIQTTVAVPVTFNSSHLTLNLSMVTPSPLGSNYVNQSTLALKVSGATISDNRQIFVSLTNSSYNNLGQTSKVPQGTTINFVADSSSQNGRYPTYTLLFTDSAGKELGFERLSEQLGIGPTFGIVYATDLPINISH